jgi:hypothetical protein
MNAYWDDRREVIASDVELGATIAALRELGRPTILFLEDRQGCLALGVGEVLSVLSFVRANGESQHSLGDPTRKGVVRFWCRGQLDDFLAETAVPEADALAAAYEFLRTGQRPSSVQWESDWG